MEGLSGGVQADYRLVALDMQVDPHIGIIGIDAGAFAVFCVEIIGDAVFETLGCVQGMGNGAIGNRCGDGEGLVQRKDLFPGDIGGASGQISGAVAGKSQERRWTRVARRER